MAYSFKDPRLAPIFARRQKARLGGTVEDTWERTTWHRILSRHNFDLAFVAVVYLAAIGSAIAVVVRFGLLNSPNTTGQGLQILFGAAVFGTFIELLRRTYDTAVKRLSTIDLFTSEILSIMRVFAAGNIVGEFVRLYDKVDSGDPDTGRSAPSGSQPSEKSLQSGFADSARKENYFSIFDKNSSDLGSLDPAVVNDITAFYTFLKASRDATGAIQLWKEPHYDRSMMKEDVVTIIYLCFLITVHGKLALERLIVSLVNREIVDDIFAGVQLQCFAFLDGILPPGDFRRPRIEQRRKTCRVLNEKHGYEFEIRPA
jgi:hypothetical protein